MRTLGKLVGSLRTAKGRKRARAWAIGLSLLVYIVWTHVQAGMLMDLLVTVALLAIWWGKVTEDSHPL